MFRCVVWAQTTFCVVCVKSLWAQQRHSKTAVAGQKKYSTRALTHTHKHIHSHKHTLTRTHTHIHSPTHAHAHTHTHMHTHTNLRTYTDTHAHTDTHTYTHIRKRTCRMNSMSSQVLGTSWRSKQCTTETELLKWTKKNLASQVRGIFHVCSCTLVIKEKRGGKSGRSFAGYSEPWRHINRSMHLWVKIFL